MAHDTTWQALDPFPIGERRSGGASSSSLAPRAGERTTARADAASGLKLRFAELAAASGDAERERLIAEVYDLVAADLYGVSLWRTGSAADASDVVQTVFLRLAAGRVAFGRVRRPRVFLLSMAHRAAIDVVRARRPTVELDEAPLLIEPGTSDAGAEATEVTMRLLELPEAQREALYLRYFAGLTFAEIGRVVGVPTFTAASRCRLGIAAMRRRMVEDASAREGP